MASICMLCKHTLNSNYTVVMQSHHIESIDMYTRKIYSTKAVFWNNYFQKWYYNKFYYSFSVFEQELEPYACALCKQTGRYWWLRILIVAYKQFQLSQWWRQPFSTLPGKWAVKEKKWNPQTTCHRTNNQNHTRKQPHLWDFAVSFSYFVLYQFY